MRRPDVAPRPTGASASCPHYPDDCVGCSLIGTVYTAQLRAKHARVVESLAAYPRLVDLTVPAVVGAPRLFGYRNQVKLVARRARRGLLLGVYRPGTHQVVDITGCPVHQTPINDVLERVRAALERSQAPIYDERSGEGWVRYVIVRSSGWKKTAQVMLVVRDRRWPGANGVLRDLGRLRGVSSVVLNINSLPGNTILGTEYVATGRDTALIDLVGGLKLTNSAGVFLQANLAAARRVYELVLRWADPQPDETAVDLYAGVGAISFYLAGQARFVLGVEASHRAVLDAKKNIRLNGYHNVRFTAEAAGDGLRRIMSEQPRVDLITLNPPRTGVDEATRAAIVESAATRVVYVSCDAATLARDLDWFAARGLVVQTLQPFDLLPQTEHVETVALLRREPAGA